MKNQKTLSHSAGPKSAHGSGTVGLAHGHFGLAGLSQGGTQHTRMVTATGAPAVMRLAGCVLGDKVLPTTTGTLPGDGPRRWGGRALTEAMWHRRGRRNGVDGGVRRRRRRSGDVLQQGEATGKVRGELNQSERLQRWRSPSRGGDGSGNSK
jgi:hypothetical protein